MNTGSILSFLLVITSWCEQLNYEGGPSADPESVDGTVFAGEKNIERNNGKAFNIKDVFNDCQVSMFND